MVPDEIIEVGGSSPAARCSLWWSKTPSMSGKRVGFIGHYERSDERAARELLERARRRLAVAGCRTAVGPVDGNTWHRYRFVTERGDRPAFFLEPDNPDSYPQDFLGAGFEPVSRYVSAEELDLQRSDPRVQRAKRRLAESGVRIRPFDPSRFDSEIDAIYDVACASFDRNFLFTAISREEFRALYAPLRAIVDPDFVRLAEHQGRAVGFAFGIVDPNDTATLIGKTQAHVAELRFAGLGAVMLDDVRSVARGRGISRIIHALIRDDNVALNASLRVATPIRGYALFGRELQ